VTGIEYRTKAVETDARSPANHWFMEDREQGRIGALPAFV